MARWNREWGVFGMIANLEKTPLFDLEDRLLGWSCVLIVSDYMSREEKETVVSFCRDKNNRGVESRYDPDNRRTIICWFSPL